jgi:hypothetical protein
MWNLDQALYMNSHPQRLKVFRVEGDRGIQRKLTSFKKYFSKSLDIIAISTNFLSGTICTL